MTDNAYIDKDGLMALVPIGKTKAYEIIRDINKELKAQGYIVIRGKAPKEYTLERLKIKKPASV
jgi:hypothetical protein